MAVTLVVRMPVGVRMIMTVTVIGQMPVRVRMIMSVIVIVGMPGCVLMMVPMLVVITLMQNVTRDQWTNPLSEHIKPHPCHNQPGYHCQPGVNLLRQDITGSKKSNQTD